MNNNINREIVFISYANPEDSNAASWLATRLTLLGYNVWCDIKNTAGGETDLWLKIQNIIENRAAKFVFLLSNASCDFEKKKGVYNEVQAASDLNIDNFILPVRIEPLRCRSPILIQRSHVIAGENWAQGLYELVDRLVRDNVPTGDVDHEKIAGWWPSLNVPQIVTNNQPEQVVSNILPIHRMPKYTYVHQILADGNVIVGQRHIAKCLPRGPAVYSHKDVILSFADSDELKENTYGVDVKTLDSVDTEHLLSYGYGTLSISTEIATNIITYLIAASWEEFARSNGLSRKALSGNARSIWYVKDGLIPNNKVPLVEPSKRKVSIQVVGEVKHNRKRYYWHFGVSPKFDLRNHFGIVMSPKHVLTKPYDASRGEAASPVDQRAAAKAPGWWNKEWRQRLLGFLEWLSGGNDTIDVGFGRQSIEIGKVPEILEADKSFTELSDDDVMKRSLRRFHG